MTRTTQNLNIIRIISMIWVFRPLKDVMSLKFCGYSAFLAFSDLFDFIFNNSSRFMVSFCNSALPIRMIFSFWHGMCSFALYRAVFASPPMTFSSFKCYAAIFAGILNHYLCFFRLNFVRTLARTCMRFGSYMSVWAHKFTATCLANKGRMTSVFYVTGLDHGHI